VNLYFKPSTDQLPRVTETTIYQTSTGDLSGGKMEHAALDNTHHFGRAVCVPR